MSTITTTSLTPQEIIKKGEDIYFQNQDRLEKENYGQYAVIDIKSKEIFVDTDKTTAVQQAKKKYPNNLFFIVQIGNLRTASNIEELFKYGLHTR